MEQQQKQEGSSQIEQLQLFNEDDLALFESLPPHDERDEKDENDTSWMARTGLTPDTLCAVVETLIFMGDKPVSVVKLKQQIDSLIPLRVLYDAIARLQQTYENSIHGIRLVEVAQGYQFRTRPAYASYVQKLFRVSSLVLAPTALEVLALVAYRGPVSRGDIDQVRGTDSAHIVRGLIEKRLVRVFKRGDDDLGRQVRYEVTPEFLEIFELASLNDLPPQGELEALATEPEGFGFKDITTRMKGVFAKQFDEEEWRLLEELDRQIKVIQTDTSLTTRLREEEKAQQPQQSQQTQQAPSASEETISPTLAPVAPQAPKKSAFEILEECLANDDVRRENILAAQVPHPTQVIVDFFWEKPKVEVTTTLEEPAERIVEVSEIEQETEQEVQQDVDLEPEQEYEWVTDEMESELIEESSPFGDVEEVIAKADNLDLNLDFLRPEIS